MWLVDIRLSQSLATVAKCLAHDVVQFAILCIYMRRIGYDSVTVNIFFTEDRQTAFILVRWFLKAMQHMGSWITISFGVRGFLLSFSSSFALNFKPPFLSVAWKPKNAPRREVRLNDGSWSLVATSPLGNSEYQTERNMTKWEQNRNPLAILALRARPKF